MKQLTRLIPAGLCLAFSCLLVACLGGGSSTTTPVIPNPVTPTLSLFAGNMGGAGNNDGPVATAHFDAPYSVATDTSGNVYVADSGNNTIRKITPAGVVSTLAGTPGVQGSADGTGAAASFDSPTGIATDSVGNVYVADTRNNTIRKITPAGVVSTMAGTPGVQGGADGIGAAASFDYPTGIATDSVGNVYVANTGPFCGGGGGFGVPPPPCIPQSTIRKITPAGVVSTMAGTPGVLGSGDGTGAEASFYYPKGIATDSVGNVYVADSGNNTIRKITPTGMVSTLAGTPAIFGSADGSGAAASFNYPTGIAIDSAGNVYVADSGNNTIRKISPVGIVSTVAGAPGVTGSADGTGTAASFNYPNGIATDSVGNVYVADSGNNTIRKITPTGMVSTLAGTPGVQGTADGTGAAASFDSPTGIATNSVGNVYVADTRNNTIRKITLAGIVSTMAGTPGVQGSADGTGAAASFDYPTGIATDSVGNVYVADSGNNTIRKITPTGMVSTLAGTPAIFGSADGTGAAASFDNPTGIATDSVGNVYVADTWNNTIRKITPTGMVSTLAGTPGVQGSADGTGTAASFNSPDGIATDSVGNVYVADSGNNTIRKISPAGIVSTVAGAPGVTGSADGTAAAASFHHPIGVATDSAGNVYVADTWNNTIRKITPDGAVSTLVGVAGVVGFMPGALPGALPYPNAVAISGTRLYITANNGVAVVNNVP